MPEADIEVSEGLVRRLLADLPEPLRWLRDEPLTQVAQGWDNSVWRVGDPRNEHGYAVRVPVRAFAAPVVEAAARWVAEVSTPLRDSGIRVPVPVFAGAPADLVPWPWFVVEWVPGQLVRDVPVAERGVVGMALAQALPSMHRAAPDGAPVNPARGIPLADRQRFTSRHLPAARSYLGAATVDRLLAVIDEALAAPAWPHQPVWCHGDLHAANLTLDTAAGAGRAAGAAAAHSLNRDVSARSVDISTRGAEATRLGHTDAGRAAVDRAAAGAAADGTVGVLDFDDLTSGDPAVDLRFLWLVLDEPQRTEAMSALEASGAYDVGIWARARGWAASSFVIPIAADPESRDGFASQLDHALGQLLVQ